MAAPLRILCLHGYTQNAISFAKKTAMFRRCLKDSADLVYITAPHVVPIPTPSSIEEREEVQEQQQQENAADLDPENLPYGWWTRSPTNAYIGLDTTLTQLATVLKDQGPFDGVMGFSQGAALAALLQLLLERPDLSPTSDLAQQYRDHGPLGFSIIVSGFLPVDPVQLGWFRSRVPRSMNRLAAKEAAAADVEKEEGAALPSRPSQNGLLGSKDDECQGVVGASLHVIGRGDVIIEPERSEALVNEYKERAPTVFYHDGGHFMPSNAASRHTYRAFVEPFVRAKLAKH